MKSLWRTSILPAALTAVVASVACRSAPASLSDADVAAIRSAIQRYIETDAAHNTQAWLQLVGENAVFMPPSHAPIEGRPAIGEFAKPHPWEQLSETPAEIDGRGDIAFVRGAWSAMLSGKPITGNYIEVWQKLSDGAWRIIRKVWNTNTT